MKSTKKILVLIAGILIAILLVFFTYQDSASATSFSKKQKPEPNAPALKIQYLW